MVINFGLFLAGCTGGGQEHVQVIQSAVPLAQILSSTPRAPSVQVGDTVLTLGVSTVEDLVNAGAVFDADSRIQSTNFSEDPLYCRQLRFSVGATSLTVQAKNLSQAIAPISESVLQSAFFDGQQICGTGGIMIGDTVDQLKEKLGEPYLLINSEEFRPRPQGAAMAANSRVYAYVDTLDNLTVMACVDRNSYQVTLIDETVPKDLITEPKELDDLQIRKLVRQFKKQITGSSLSAQLMDSQNKNQNIPTGTLSSISFNTIKVLTLNRIRDARTFYRNRQSMYDRAVFSSYLIFEYDAIITLNKGTPEQTRQDVKGCFYIPGAWRSDEGEVMSSLDNVSFKQLQGVYLSEASMLEALFPDAEQGYSITDFTAMERTI